MTEIEHSEYGGMALEPHNIDYEDIDPPLRHLIRLINCQPWIRTYGCCAGHAHHGDEDSEKHKFFIGLFVNGEVADLNDLRFWLVEANGINGPTGLRAEVESVHKHPFGHGSVDGWYAYRVVVQESPGRKITSLIQSYARVVRCLEVAWDKLWLID